MGAGPAAGADGGVVEDAGDLASEGLGAHTGAAAGDQVWSGALVSGAGAGVGAVGAVGAGVQAAGLAAAGVGGVGAGVAGAGGFVALAPPDGNLSNGEAGAAGSQRAGGGGS